MLDKISTKALAGAVLACAGAAYGALQGTDSANEAFKVASWWALGGAAFVGTGLALVLVLRLLMHVFPTTEPNPSLPSPSPALSDTAIIRTARTLLEEGQRLGGQNSTLWQARHANRDLNPILDEVQAWDRRVAETLGAHPVFGRYISESRRLTPLALGQNAILRRCNEIREFLNASDGHPPGPEITIS